MIKIYDCSNSEERPVHRNTGGPKENDIVRYLKMYCSNYDCEFVNDIHTADVIFTNDIFDKKSLETGLPRVKRMDGIFLQKDLLSRNELYNRAAEQANRVIFITKYSYDVYNKLYNVSNLKKCDIIHHWVDCHIFNPKHDYKRKRYDFCASATDWNRAEKRIADLISMANIFPLMKFCLIGKADNIKLPVNIDSLGYIPFPDVMATILKTCHAFVNLTYRDAATKTVCQAINCGLPVLYSATGGVSEMIEYCNLSYGYGIPEDNQIKIYEEIPHLEHDEIHNSTIHFFEHYQDYKDNIEKNLHWRRFSDMLGGYFQSIRSVVSNGTVAEPVHHF